LLIRIIRRRLRNNVISPRSDIVDLGAIASTARFVGDWATEWRRQSVVAGVHVGCYFGEAIISRMRPDSNSKSFCSYHKPALQLAEEEWTEQRGAGAVIITGNQRQDKFFSNGLVGEELLEGYQVFPALDRLARALFTYPLPIICAINGHAFAAGFFLALACDYRVMTSGNAWCCMNEVHFGAPLPATATAILRAKIPDPARLRKCALEGHRFTAQECLSYDIVDELADGGSEAVLATAMELADKVKAGAKTGVWGLIKEEIYRDVISTIDEGRRADFSSAKL